MGKQKYRERQQNKVKALIIAECTEKLLKREMQRGMSVLFRGQIGEIFRIFLTLHYLHVFVHFLAFRPNLLILQSGFY